MPGEGKAERDHHPENHKVGEEPHFSDIGTQAADAHAKHLLINAVLLRLCGSQDDDLVPQLL